MLIFAGIGLWDEMDISLRCLEEVKKADKVCIETHTSKLNTSIERIEKILGREIKVLSRSDVEEKSSWLIEEAKEKDVVLLVPGDPMVATTHSALRLEAESKGVKTKVIHGASVVSAVCVSGLQYYRFGKTATVSYPYKGKVSRYPVDVIRDNWKINAHTLLLLDLNPPMKVPEAVEILKKAGAEDWWAVAVGGLGGEKPDLKCDLMSKLLDFDCKGLHCLVVLAKSLHFMEYECLRVFADAPKDLERIVK